MLYGFCHGSQILSHRVEFLVACLDEVKDSAITGNSFAVVVKINTLLIYYDI